MKQIAALWLVVLILTTGCATPAANTPAASAPSGGAPEGSALTRTGPKRVTVAIHSSPPTLNARLNLPSAAGFEAAEELLHSGLTTVDHLGNLHPVLAEAVPTADNGLWKLLPDGTMETSWKLRNGAQWHDGVPMTAEDLVFTTRVAMDRELSMFRHVAHGSIDRAESTDPQTVTVRWKSPFIEADGLFSRLVYPMPLPSHLLEKPYTEDKAGFTQLPYWTTEFVGTGPYRLRELLPGSHLVMEANDRYVLGRPKVDVFEFKFILDLNTMITTVLAGGADMTVGFGISPELAVQTRQRWQNGQVRINPTGWVSIYPQMLNPTPSVVGDARFRRALVHAIDRQQLADTIMAGVVPAADTIVHPSQVEYSHIERSIARYQHDPRRAGQIIESLGYTRGSDGMFRDAAGQRLSVEMRTTDTLDLHIKSIFPIADDWKRIGVEVESVLIPPQLTRDQQYRATYPAFELSRSPNELRGLANYYSRGARLPENNWVGQNRTRYMSPELDAQLDRFFTSVPLDQRMQALGQVLSHLSDVAVPLPLYYDAQGVLVANRIQNVTEVSGEGSIVWNVLDWDVR